MKGPKDVCTLTVDAGVDFSICNDGSSATLNGNVIGNAIAFSWSPATGLSNPNSLTPTVSVATSTTYTLTAQELENTIPIPNGDFEAGNSSFTSDYNYVDPANPIGFVLPGSYTIITSPELIWSNLPPCDDHTFGNGTGQSMVVNGNSFPGESVWCTTLPVTANTDYYFSGWVSTLNPIDPPFFEITVNGTSVGNPVNAQNTPCNWEPFGAAFQSGAATTVNICINNLNLGNGVFGNDFALDDLSLNSVCTVTDEVTVYIWTPQAIIDPPVVLDCNAADLCTNLSGNAVAPIGSVDYQWTAAAGGNIQNGATSANPLVCGTGTYSLVITETVGLQSCSSDPTTVNVVDNMAFPPLPVINGPVEVCNGGASQLSISMDPAYEVITWLVPPTVTIIGGQGTAIVDVLFTGFNDANICVAVENNCTNTEQACLPIAINQAPISPNIGGPLTVCENANPVYSILSLDPTATSYTWTASGGGQITGGQGTNTVSTDWSASNGGQLCATADNDCGMSPNTCIDINVVPQTVVTNITLTTLDPAEVGVVQNLYPSSTGCDSLVITTTVLINSFCQVNVDAGPDLTICSNDAPVQLNGNVSGNQILGFEWTPAIGLSDPTILNPMATTSTTTTYTLTGQSLDDADLIQNGDFEQGNVLFSTLYTLGTSSCLGLGFLDCEGTYAVIN
ncbi:MAG: hypothetical protein AAGD05_14555, partial [Bacteroidota bacterium]